MAERISPRRRLIRLTCGALFLLALVLAGYAVATRINPHPHYEVGDQIDALNGVAIYFNGGVNNTNGRNLSADGYNLGLRYQCVEFVKRYYFERHGHRMPDSYGHAKDFFDPALADGALSRKRAMLQYINGSGVKPAPDDLLVFGPTPFNPYGHVAIVAAVGADSLEMAQQNPGPFAPSREVLPLKFHEGKWSIDRAYILGWLRLPTTTR